MLLTQTKDGSNSYSCLQLARIYSEKNYSKRDISVAIENYKKALELLPTESQIYLFLGILHIEAKQEDTAKKYFQEE